MLINVVLLHNQVLTDLILSVIIMRTMSSKIGFYVTKIHQNESSGFEIFNVLATFLFYHFFMTE